MYTFNSHVINSMYEINVRINVKSAQKVDYGIEYLVSQSMLESAGENVDSYLKGVEELLKKEIGTTAEVQIHFQLLQLL